MIQKGGVSNAGDRNQLRYKIEYMHKYAPIKYLFQKCTGKHYVDRTIYSVAQIMKTVSS